MKMENGRGGGGEEGWREEGRWVGLGEGGCMHAFMLSVAAVAL